VIASADLGQLALFADLPDDELAAIAQGCGEVSFAEGEWIVREGDPQTDLHVIVDGAVTVVIGNEDRRVLGKGSFFGEVSVLLEETASASILTRTPVRCLVVDAAGVKDFLVDHPQVMFRMLRAEARRLRTASQWPI
jgi:CRP/FNR family cyclic AMP-dependent transcriptional regulator